MNWTEENDPEWSWRYQAKCAGIDTEIFFPPRDRSLYKPIADKAKAICFGKDGSSECPVRKTCLVDALERDEQHGIWGGMSHRERNALIRRWKKSGKGRTLKEFVWNL
jgi:WhiB family redox-sensing transcriptional regulator